MFITIFTCHTDKEYLALLQFPCLSDFHLAYLMMFLGDIPIDFAFNDAPDLVEWIEHF